MFIWQIHIIKCVLNIYIMHHVVILTYLAGTVQHNNNKNIKEDKYIILIIENSFHVTKVVL